MVENFFVECFQIEMGCQTRTFLNIPRLVHDNVTYLDLTIFGGKLNKPSTSNFFQTISVLMLNDTPGFWLLFRCVRYVVFDVWNLKK